MDNGSLKLTGMGIFDKSFPTQFLIILHKLILNKIESFFVVDEERKYQTYNSAFQEYDHDVCVSIQRVLEEYLQFDLY
jgi:hypothetical protein